MDGLIKGLLDVALGHHDNKDDESAESRDERSRSSWAQVVSGDQDGEEEPGKDPKQHGYNRPQPNRQALDEGYHQSEVSEQQNNNRNPWNRKKQEGQDNNDGWETVGKKPSKQQHKVINILD